MIRGIAKTIYHWIGWKLEGRYPHEIKKKIIIVAPHTSKVDFFVGILVKFWLDLRVTFYAKQELFKGIIGWFLRSIGGRPVDRSRNTYLVGQAVADFKRKDSHTILLTPEGTRKRVESFKSGFYYIAVQAAVPIVPIAFDYGRKVIKIMPTLFVRGDGPSEIEEIRTLFKDIQGRIPEYGVH